MLERRCAIASGGVERDNWVFIAGHGSTALHTAIEIPGPSQLTWSVYCTVIAVSGVHGPASGHQAVRAEPH
jgi:hypothetical protein